MRIVFLTGSITGLLYIVLGRVFPLLLIWSAASGYLSTVLYRRYSGRSLSTGGGARLGWMQALLAFAMATVLFTLQLIVYGTEDLRRVMFSSIEHDARYQQYEALYKNPSVVGTVVVIVWVMIGIMVSLSAVAGGAIGASVNKRR